MEAQVESDCVEYVRKMVRKIESFPLPQNTCQDISTFYDALHGMEVIGF